MSRLITGLLTIAVMVLTVTSGAFAAAHHPHAGLKPLLSWSGEHRHDGGNGGHHGGDTYPCSAVSCASSVISQGAGGIVDQFPTVRWIDPAYDFVPVREIDLDGDPPVPRNRLS